jgi:tyrosyl-tRNA synthetase
MKALNVNKLTKSGCTFKFWIADWFALLNNKMGGDLKKIQNVGKYMIEVRKAANLPLLFGKAATPTGDMENGLHCRGP